jgi:hypothetical protein
MMVRASTAGGCREGGGAHSLARGGASEVGRCWSSDGSRKRGLGAAPPPGSVAVAPLLLGALLSSSVRW